MSGEIVEENAAGSEVNIKLLTYFMWSVSAF